MYGGGGVEIQVDGYAVDSHVGAQPVSDFETQSGAVNRAREVKAKLAADGARADFYVGVGQDFFL